MSKRLQQNQLTDGVGDDTPIERALTPKETAAILGVSESFLAKKRMSGDGPPYVTMGRNVRYLPSRLRGWIKSQERLSTSE